MDKARGQDTKWNKSVLRGQRLWFDSHKDSRVAKPQKQKEEVKRWWPRAGLREEGELRFNKDRVSVLKD